MKLDRIWSIGKPRSNTGQRKCLFGSFDSRPVIVLKVSRRRLTRFTEITRLRCAHTPSTLNEQYVFAQHVYRYKSAIKRKRFLLLSTKDTPWKVLLHFPDWISPGKWKQFSLGISTNHSIKCAWGGGMKPISVPLNGHKIAEHVYLCMWWLGFSRQVRRKGKLVD